MKIVILAAGVGSRLNKSDLPKPLTQLECGVSILEWQIQQFTKHFNMHDIIIAVGFKKEIIMEKFPDLLYVFCPDFKNENTSQSLLRSIHKVHDDLIWINGDVVFHESVLDNLLENGKATMLVNQTSVSNEEVKYITDNSGLITHVSKKVEHAEGEALGINYFPKKAQEQLKQALSICAKTDYFEKGIEICIQEGLAVHAAVIDINKCVEVDFKEDLNKANHLIKLWSKV